MKVTEIEIIDAPSGYKEILFTTTDNKVYSLLEGHDGGTFKVIVQYEMTKEEKETVLTVICNKGVHPIPEDQLPGEVFVATEGSLPMEHEPLREAVREALKKVSEKIHELKPQKVFLVPSGLPVVLSQLQALCMQMLSKPAVILQWDRDKSKYFEIDIIPRDVLTA